MAMTAILGQIGIDQSEIQLASDGEEAIQNCQNRLETLSNTNPFYELILMDFSMPVMDGPTAVRHILTILEEYQAQAPIPYIVCVTAYSGEKYDEKARNVGMNEFVTKPFSKSKI